ncbi:LOG family protein, partial [Sphingobium sp.]
GTMDELWEAISWAQLGYHSKPVGLLNVAGFYDQLIGFNRQMVEAGFIRAQHAGIMIHADGIEALVDAMSAYQPHETIFAMKADRL